MYFRFFSLIALLKVAVRNCGKLITIDLAPSPAPQSTEYGMTGHFP
jgi:hypothetical protein